MIKAGYTWLIERYVTAQCEFLAQMLERTIRQAIPQEIHFLQKFDQARKAETRMRCCGSFSVSRAA